MARTIIRLIAKFRIRFITTLLPRIFFGVNRVFSTGKVKAVSGESRLHFQPRIAGEYHEHPEFANSRAGLVSALLPG
jgi:hypothetical protein